MDIIQRAVRSVSKDLREKKDELLLEFMSGILGYKVDLDKEEHCATVAKRFELFKYNHSEDYRDNVTKRRITFSTPELGKNGSFIMEYAYNDEEEN